MCKCAMIACLRNDCAFIQSKNSLHGEACDLTSNVDDAEKYIVVHLRARTWQYNISAARILSLQYSYRRNIHGNVLVYIQYKTYIYNI